MTNALLFDMMNAAHANTHRAIAMIYLARMCGRWEEQQEHMGAIIQWLFTDPQTAGGTGPGGSELFHFFLPWIIFCSAGILIPFYYWVEGRKRFFKKNVLNKRLMDKYMNKLVLIALVGWPIMGAREFLDNSPLAWRVWRYAWLVWLAVVAFRLLFYLIAKYPEERRDYLRNERLLQYFPKPNVAKREAKAGKR